MKIKVPKFLKRKRNIWIIAILVVIVLVGFWFFTRSKAPGNIQTDTVLRQNLEETVLATGQVISITDLDLSFQASGTVSRVYVKEGDHVSAGQTLVSLDQSIALANLTSAKGSLAQAQASYDKYLTGVTNEVSLNSAYQNGLNAVSDAYLKSDNALSAATALQNTYFVGFDGDARQAKIQIESSIASLKIAFDKARISGIRIDIDSAVSAALYSLNTVSDGLKVIRETLDEPFYYGRIPDAEKTAIDTQRTYINTALTNVIAYQQAIYAAKTGSIQSQADIDLALAQILSAQGQVDSANATLNNLVVRAPSSGTITEVDAKVGEFASATTRAVVLQDVDSLYAQANVSEANIASLVVGQDVDYTFDALGPDEHFNGKILNINPASTVNSGVVNYQIKGSLEDVPDIKPGMTANMTILVAKKDNTLAVPSTAVINKNNKKYVRVIDDLKNLTYHEVEIKSGLQADGGLIEILSGLREGQTIITYMK